MFTVFIDGKEGTTGLRIYDRLSARDDISLITLSEEDRKNREKRRQALNSCDIAFLCLPDAAAVEAVEMVENSSVKIIDTSTAHRTDKEWVYGFAELDRKEQIRNSGRVAVPGCHASGFIALVYPLIKHGFISPESNIFCNSISGYSGGGKKMIAEYETSDRDILLNSPRQYALGQEHKHLKEMKAITELKKDPVFCPFVSGYYSGMEVTVPLFKETLNGRTKNDLKELYKNFYSGPVVRYIDQNDVFAYANQLSDKDYMEISVRGNDERILLIAQFDNLGKGASGAAIQCMNIMMGLDETKGLEF